MNDSSDVLFLGLGRMGLPMAGHAIRHGLAVAGYDPQPGPREALAAAGGRPVQDLGTALSRARQVVVVVGLEHQVEELFHGEAGILACCRPGTLVLQVSTVDPARVEALGAEAERRRIRLLDTPVCRAEMGARAGTLLALVAGEHAAYLAAQAVLGTFCSDIFYVGPRLGAGQVAKSVNNSILWACAVANFEGLRLAEGWQIDTELLRRALVTSSADNWSLRMWEHVGEMPWAIKDMEILERIARNAAVPMPLAKRVRELVVDLPVLHHAEHEQEDERGRKR
jgi:3-hydroxyisobutyrate dehydrogenase-like beta-hydroxyacid dehydrogenase